MRVTHRQLGETSLRQIQQNMLALQKNQTQLATQLRFQSAGEDPAGANDVLVLSSQLRKFEQFGRNQSVADARLRAEETAVGDLQNFTTRIKELAMSVADSRRDGSRRYVVKAEVDEIFNAVVGVLNQSLNGEYLFGGEQIATVPVTATPPGLNFSTSGATQGAALEVAPNAYVTTGHAIAQVAGDTTSGILASLRDLSAALGADDPAAVVATLAGIDQVFESLNITLGEIGARSNTVNAAQSAVSALGVNAERQRSGVQDVDIAAVSVELSRRETAYQASLSVTQRLLNLNLASLMR